jgi:hypothetical protein
MSTETQLRNEALVRLLIAARYLDAKLSLDESESLQQHIDELPWDSGTGKSIFVMRETARIRESLSTDITRQKFLVEQCQFFKAPENKAMLLKMLEAVLFSDGDDTKENRFLAQLESILDKK